MTVKVNGQNLPRRFEMEVARKTEEEKTNKYMKQKWLVRRRN